MKCRHKHRYAWHINFDHGHLNLCKVAILIPKKLMLTELCILRNTQQSAKQSGRDLICFYKSGNFFANFHDFVEICE